MYTLFFCCLLFFFLDSLTLSHTLKKLILRIAINFVACKWFKGGNCNNTVRLAKIIGFKV